MLWMVLAAAGWLGEPPAHCADQTQTGLSACAAAEDKAAEQKLNDAYRALLPKLPGADQARLRDAERAWVAWRDKECLMRTGGGMEAGGTMAPMLVSQCQRDLARERAAFLEQLLKCSPGDLSCPAE